MKKKILVPILLATSMGLSGPNYNSIKLNSVPAQKNIENTVVQDTIAQDTPKYHILTKAEAEMKQEDLYFYLGEVYWNSGKDLDRIKNRNPGITQDSLKSGKKIRVK